MSISIYDVARTAGVSVVTVSRVLNNSPTVREKNRQRVLDAIKELGYQPNAAAQSLAKGKTGVIGVVIPSLDDSFMMRVLASIEAILRKQGMYLILSVISEDEPLDASNCVKLFTEARVDGILILKPLENEPYILELKKRDFPFVLLDQHHTDKQISTVMVDNVYGGYQATRKLIEDGAKIIAHIKGSPAYQSSHERYQGYCRALSEAGIPLREEWVAQGQFSMESGYTAMHRWLSQGMQPDAVFAADDHIAFGAIDAIRQHRLTIPGDIEVIGYDDHPFSATLFSGITTVRQPAEALAQNGIELLLSMINGDMKRYASVVLQPELVLRATTR
jgi:LacI family transcriptional regulator